MKGQCQCQCQPPKSERPSGQTSSVSWLIVTIVALVIWGFLYGQLPSFSAWVVSLFPISQVGHLHEALVFFFYDAPKVLMLLALVVFVMGVVRSFFSPDHIRTVLAGKHEGVGNIAAACLGIITPFCSCSAVPLFLGFVSAGVPLGVTFSFLIAAPMVNEVALALLFGLVGPKIAISYLVLGLGIAVVAGWVIGRLHLEGWLEDWVRKAREEVVDLPPEKISFAQRIQDGLCAVREIVGKVWPWMLGGIAAGAMIHGYAPSDLLVSIMGKETWWSVPASVLVGVPMYSNAAGIIPVVEALLDKGAALGTVLAFMMSVTALSLPEAIILRKVLSVRLILVYFGIVATGILMVGFLFNL